VFATVRRPADGEALTALTNDRITPLLIDVTDHGQLEGAVARVPAEVGDDGLDVMMNNAGVGVFMPLELVPTETFRRQLEINLIGHLAVTQQFLPLLRRATGHVGMMGSIADRITIPFAGPPVVAKHALLGDATAAQDRFGPPGHKVYGTTFQHMMARALAQAEQGSSPAVVADVVSRATRAHRPKSRSLMGNHRVLLATPAKLPRVRRRPPPGVESPACPLLRLAG
jgi:NAD(P)-dependent dehydrogenase (short-subunit alcohol dehydrogenase family)